MADSIGVGFPPRIERFPNIPAARASFDRLDRCWPLTHELEGWFLSPHVAFDAINAYLNTDRIGPVELVHRDDVRDTFPWMSHAQRGGFRVKLDPYLLRGKPMNYLDFIGYAMGQPRGHAHTLFQPDVEDVTPSPPEKLMVRVAGHGESMTFKLGGLKCFGDFYDSITRHHNGRSRRRLLDWGCGCGRVTVHFLSHDTGMDVFGCDIDPEAIAWCTENLRPGRFTHVGHWPPLPYADGTFDIILGYSVFTHLTRTAQAAWLTELRRVLAPGGLIIASVHGAFAAAFEWPPHQAAELLRNGIFDQNPDESLSGVVEHGYYQNTFQTREYTLQEWAKHIDIVEYVEAGMNSYQDMVVMRR